jgi:hypothetical protein
MLVAFATILGCLAMPWLAENQARTLAFYFTLMMIFIVLTFGKIFLSWPNRAPWFSFAFSLDWSKLCRLHAVAAGAIPDGCRATAFAFWPSFARWRFSRRRGRATFYFMGIPSR